ncbi:hypothetical protein CNYM01_00522 [Colletotrichum nymphaeae SA-01]|uniref:Uncharacterized protein n=1 Tax=Colletotrichum nymphaeae SA-01 TaxID=1460502 RepID=A0A135TVQ9_9PEZI|nr:hypothetical protein CNYM01_00522 [Colletotrichum nymphaeae SA-01]
MHPRPILSSPASPIARRPRSVPSPETGTRIGHSRMVQVEEEHVHPHAIGSGSQLRYPTAGASKLWNATDECPSPSSRRPEFSQEAPNEIKVYDDAQTGLKALRALPSISTNPMGLLSRPPHIFIPSSLLVGPRPSFHQATSRGRFLVSLGHSLSLSITPWCSWLRYPTLSEAASPVTTAPITSG